MKTQKQPYQYTPLDPKHIRVLTLLPGTGTLQIKIQHQRRHASVDPVKITQPDSGPADDLPPGWEQHQTLDGRTIYSVRGGERSSWTRPTTSMMEDWSKEGQKHEMQENVQRYAGDGALQGGRRIEGEEESKEDWKLKGEGQLRREEQTREKKEEDIAYEAVSYTWSSLLLPDVVDVVDKDLNNRQTLLISGNLVAALHQLRYTDEPRRLWADAICIDQNNVRERNEQVQQMSSVFSGAKQVLIWLGPEADNSRLAIDTMSFIGSQALLVTAGFFVTSPDATSPEWTYTRRTPTLPRASWLAVDKLMQRLWFERVWIIQEAALSKSATMYCGAAQMSWGLFQSAIDVLYSKLTLPPLLPGTRISYIAGLTGAYDWNNSIRATLLRAIGRGCSDPRDAVYALMGMFPQRFRSRISVQYSDPLAQVYMDFTREHCLHVERLELFNFVNWNARVAGSPTWTPNFASRYTPRNDLQFAAGYSRSHLRFPQSHIMVAHGVRSGTVTWASSPIPDYFEAAHRYPDFVEAVKKLLRHNVSCSAACRDSPQDVLARSLTGNCIADRLPHYGVPSITAWRNEVGSPDGLFGVLKDNSTPAIGKHSSFMSDLALAYLLGRTYFETDKGHFGLGVEAQRGDVVATVLGCHSPILLREDAMTPGSFVVVGECFVHELADANAFLGPLPPQYRVQLFSNSVADTTYYALFKNDETGSIDEHDPRTGPLPPEWERARDVQRTANDPSFARHYRNKETGEVVNWDPRMEPEMLKKRGVQLEWFTLI